MATREIQCVKDGNLRLKRLKYTVSAKPDAVADPTRRYLIDYASLSNWTKTSTLLVDKYENGMLKQVNAGAEDRSAQVVTSLATTVGTIAVKAVSGVAVMSRAESNAEIYCNDDTKKKIEVAALLRNKVNLATTQVTESTREFSQVAEATRSLGSQVNASHQQRVMLAASRVEAAKRDLDKATVDYSKALLDITDSTAFVWPLSGKPDSQGPELPYQEVEIPFAPAKIQGETKEGTKIDLTFDNPMLKLSRQTPAAADKKPALAQSPGEESGIRYRVPVAAKLVLCAPAECDAVAQSPGKYVSRNVPPVWEGPAAQLGQVFYLPYRNGSFRTT